MGAMPSFLPDTFIISGADLSEIGTELNVFGRKAGRFVFE